VRIVARLAELRPGELERRRVGPRRAALEPQLRLLAERDRVAARTAACMIA